MQDINFINLDDVDSTNSYARSLDDLPDDRLTVVRARRQTGGRGRCGKDFFSDHEGGLWVSIVSPIEDISEHFNHNRATSLAILESLKSICADNNDDARADIKIKWPNDIYWGGKKIAGILLENAPHNPDVIIIGFGVNVNIGIDDFPEELRVSVTSVLIETGRELSAEKLLDDILARYSTFIGDAGCHKLYADSLYKKGDEAAVNGRSGTFVTVDPDGRLRLETDCGHELFSSGTLRFTGGCDE